VWAEYIRTREQLFEKLLPRLTAIAEVAWTGSGDDKWEEFSRRVTSLTELWDAKRLTWHRSEGVDWK
jgi:hexosaminidase